MPVKEDKSPFCLGCQYVFDEIRKYHAQNRCNPCYQKLYIDNKFDKVYGVKGRPRQRNLNCVKCDAEFDTLNSKGKAIKRGSKGMCKTCYCKSFKPSKFCNSCNNEMMKGSNTGLCPVCRLNRSQERKKRPIKIKLPPIVDKEQFELIRRLLVRYKVGHNTIVDTFRVIDVYMDVNDNPIILDTLSEGAQLVEMLRNLKEVFDYNLHILKEISITKSKKTMKEYQKEWYEKSPNSYKNKCKEKWN